MARPSKSRAQSEHAFKQQLQRWDQWDDKLVVEFAAQLLLDSFYEEEEVTERRSGAGDSTASIDEVRSPCASGALLDEAERSRLDERAQLREQQDRALQLALDADRREQQRRQLLLTLQESARAAAEAMHPAAGVEDSMREAHTAQGQCDLVDVHQHAELITLTLGLPSGGRCKRRFGVHVRVSSLLEWAQQECALHEGHLLERFELLVPGFPPRRLSAEHGDDLASTHGIAHRCLLRVSELASPARAR
jgi:hypothetical protein